MRVNQSGTMGNGGTDTGTMTYTYLGDGTRAAARAGVDATSYAGKRYRGSFVYDVTAGGVQSLESVAVSTGRLIALTGTNGAISFESDGFITDHLGNVAVVVNLSASSATATKNAILEQNEYTPFGTKLSVSGLKSQTANRWRYAGKEEQDIAGMNLRLLDFGARYYDSFTCRWNAVDPLAHKYFPMSPYNYCGNDPVNKFDPDGRDIFEIDNEGRIVNRIEDNTQDTFYMVEKNDKGDYERTGASVSFEYGTVESVRSISFEQRDGTIDTYDVYQIIGDKNGTQFFEFLAKGVADNKIEVSQAKCGIQGEKGLNFVTTGHTLPSYDVTDEGKILRTSREISMTYLYGGQLQNGYYIREMTHSHPESTTASKADRGFAAMVSCRSVQQNFASPSFKIWHVPSNSYFPFTY